jgi:hypothetical protein
VRAVTGNRLADGRVVYLAPDDTWTERIACALLLEADDAEPVLAAAKTRVREIANAYLIDADANGAAGREALREGIRAMGPTVRPDLQREEKR